MTILRFQGAALLLFGLVAACGDGSSSGGAGRVLDAATRPAPESSPWFLTEEEVERLYLMQVPGRRYDPWTHTTQNPDRRNRYRWPEHPQEQWLLVTNEQSLREDEDVLERAVDLRVLVTGDSHTDGVCMNSESYTNVLEALLQERYPDRTVDCINAGYGGHSFYNYVGTLQKWRYLEPDVFVVGVFGGNDFLELLEPHHHFAGSARPNGGRDYQRRIGRGRRASGDGPDFELGKATISQGFNQLIYMGEFPEQRRLALRGAVERTEELAAICAEDGIELLVLYIPAPLDVDREMFGTLFDDVGAGLELAEEDFGWGAWLGDEYLARVEEMGVETLDARALFVDADEPVYWAKDHHINLAGHRLVAEALLPRIVALTTP